jgi:large subunit ribosomal protein L25
MEKNSLEVQVRQDSGKTKAKEVRAAGLIPAILYGRHMKENVKLSVPLRDFVYKVEHSIAGRNTIFQLLIKNDSKQAEEMAIAHDIQYDTISGQVIHIDFRQVNVKEKIITLVPLKIVGIASGIKMGGQLVELMSKIEVSCLPLDIPNFIEIDVTSLEIGDGIRCQGLKIPANVEVLNAPDQMVIHLEGPREEEVAPVAAAAAAAAPAAGAAATTPAAGAAPAAGAKAAAGAKKEDKAPAAKPAGPAKK